MKCKRRMTRKKPGSYGFDLRELAGLLFCQIPEGKLTDEEEQCRMMTMLLFGSKEDSAAAVSLDRTGRVIGCSRLKTRRPKIEQLANKKACTQLLIAHSHGTMPLIPSPDDIHVMQTLSYPPVEVKQYIVCGLDVGEFAGHIHSIYFS